MFRVKTIVVLGSNGLLGQSIVRKFKNAYNIIGSSIEQHNINPKLPGEQYFSLDITNRKEVKKTLVRIKPDIIINAAAFTDVDGCEEKVDLCWGVNSRGLECIIDACTDFSPLLVQVSTDYVFDGNNAPYSEDDLPNPEGFYGKSKLAAERFVNESTLEYIIARTQILYGSGLDIKKNFALWVIEKLRNKQKIYVVNDQIGNPTYVDDLSEAIFKLIDLEEFGVFHIAGEEKCSRYEFALSIAEQFNFDKSLIEETTTHKLNQKAPRPMDSSFNLDKLYNRIDWLPGGLKSGLQRLKKQLEDF